jgi:quercetin dioxygenase-like cupin family protein
MMIAAAPAVAGSTPALDPKRLTLIEVMGRPTVSAGPGTSGIGDILTRVLVGDPSAAGAYTIMLHVPANTQIAAHRHKDDRVATVVSGTWNFGYGSTASDDTKALGPGSFYTEPAGVSHFARTGAEPVVLYIHGIGPTDTHYSVPSADPRR